MYIPLFVQDDLFDDWGLMAVWDEGERWQGLGYDEVCLLAFGD